MKTKRFAGIDIGSNSVRLLITDIINYNGSPIFKKEHYFRIPLKLGEDTFSTGSINDEKKKNLAILMECFKGIMTVCGVEQWRACATSAIREASNVSEVIDYIYNQTGMQIDVIDAKEEAHFIVLNNQALQYEQDQAYLFVDVGGGSVDLVLYYREKEVASDSFRLGTIRPSSLERENPEWERLKLWIETYSSSFPRFHLIGSGGNINRVDSVLRRCGKIKREELVSFHRKLKDMTIEERAIKYNLNLNRADVIIPAIQIYLRIMKMAKALIIETPIIGVSDGIIKDLYFKNIAQKAEINI